MPKPVEKRICCSCDDPKNPTHFYKSYSEFYFDGVLPICKECFSRKFGQYAAQYHSNKKAMQRMCMAFDIYFDEDLFDKCDTDDSTVVGKYFRQLNMNQNKGKTFDTTIDNGDFSLSGDRKQPKEKRVAIVDQYGNEQDYESGEINPKDIEKWGVGLEPIDYAILNSHYRLLSNSNPQCDGNAEIFIIDLCYTKMQQMKAVRESRVDDYKKLTESYIKSFEQAGLKTVKDTNAMEDFTFGVNAETIEKYTPAEYYKNKSLYKDHDNIGDYIDRFLLRPLRNLMRGTRDRDVEFFVKEEEENDDFTDDE